MRNLLALLLFVPSLCLAQLPQFVSETGLIGWYPLDGDIINAANPDEPSILTGGNFVLGQDGFAEGALEITNGSSAEIHPEIGTTESLTVSMWLNEDTNSGNSTALYTALYLGQQGFDGDTTKSLDITRDRINHPGNGRLQANLNYDFGTAGFDELDGGWVHLVSVFDSGLLSTYRNGFLMESTVSSVSGISITGASFLGAGHVGNSTEPFNFCHCALDDVGIWNRVLNEAEVQALFLGAPIEYGCTDPGACNFQDEASADDGSCEYGCLFCGEGTVWDSTLQQCVSIAPPCAPSCGQGTVWDPINEECIIAIPADLNYDGCVTVNDLLELLAVHGTCPPYPEWPDEPTDTTWTCGDPITYWDCDYATVLIGDQCWFADNLRSTQYQTGDSIVLWDYEGEVDTYGLGHYTYKDLNTANADTFGLLYTWHAATHELQLCPTGWHTPSQQEFQNLMNATDVISGDLSSTAQVTALQSSSIWTLGTGSNATGFSALPGSQRTPWGGLGYGDQYEEAFWWTSDQDGFDFVNLSLAEPLNGEEKQIKFDTCDNPNDAMSIRCIQD